MSLSLSLQPRLQLLAALECALCGQLFSTRRRNEDATEEILLGSAPYAFCPTCLQKVPKPWTPQYKRRWTLQVKRLRKP